MTEDDAEDMARSLGLALEHMRKALIHIQMAHESDGRLNCCEAVIKQVMDQVGWAQGEAEEVLDGA